MVFIVQQMRKVSDSKRSSHMTLSRYCHAVHDGTPEVQANPAFLDALVRNRARVIIDVRIQKCQIGPTAPTLFFSRKLVHPFMSSKRKHVARDRHFDVIPNEDLSPPIRQVLHESTRISSSGARRHLTSLLSVPDLTPASDSSTLLPDLPAADYAAEDTYTYDSYSDEEDEGGRDLRDSVCFNFFWLCHSQLIFRTTLYASL